MFTRSHAAIVVGGLLLAIAGTVWYGELTDEVRPTSSLEAQPLAARYHLRQRTSNFYERARSGGSLSTRAHSR